MPSLSTTPSGAATLQGHGLVVADGALGRAMARLLLEQAPALTLTLTGRTPDPRPDTRQLLQQALDRLAYGALDLCRDEQLADLGTHLDRLDRPLRLVFDAGGRLHGQPPIRPLKSAWPPCGVLRCTGALPSTPGDQRSLPRRWSRC